MWDDCPLLNKLFTINLNIFNTFYFSVDLDVIAQKNQYLDLQSIYLSAWLGSAPEFYDTGIYVVPHTTPSFFNTTAAAAQQLKTQLIANGVRLNSYFQAATEYGPAGVFSIRADQPRIIIPYGYKLQAMIFQTSQNSAQSGYNATLAAYGKLMTCGS